MIAERAADLIRFGRDFELSAQYNIDKIDYDPPVYGEDYVPQSLSENGFAELGRIPNRIREETLGHSHLWPSVDQSDRANIVHSSLGRKLVERQPNNCTQARRRH